MLLLPFATVLGAVGRVAVVTGGTRGIGRGVAESFAERGYDLLLTFQSDTDAAEATRKYLSDTYGVRVTCVMGDLTREETRDKIFDTYDSEYGCLSAMVHNAGQYVGITSSNADRIGVQTGGFGEGTLDAQGRRAMRYYQKLYGDAYIDLCSRAMMRMTEGGSLIGISSPGCTLQYNPNAGYDLPGSGKCIMEYASRLFALRGAARGIRSNVVIPGITETQAWEKIASTRGIDPTVLVSNLADRIAPMGTMKARELGDTIAWLCSDDGKWVTGVSLPVDGGVHLKT